MPQENTASNSPSETPQQQADRMWQRLDELILEVDAAGDIDGRKPPPEKVKALISDAMSLIKGIANGAITTGQPRIATNLIEAVQELASCGHWELASEPSLLLRDLSVNGLTAEGCVLGRSRIAPQKR